MTRGAHDAVGSGRAGPVHGPRRVRRVTRAATSVVRIAATPVPATACLALGAGAAPPGVPPRAPAPPPADVDVDVDVDGGGVETVAAVVAREVRGTAEARGPAHDVPQVRDVVVDVLVGLA